MYQQRKIIIVFIIMMMCLGNTIQYMEHFVVPGIEIFLNMESETSGEKMENLKDADKDKSSYRWHMMHQYRLKMSKKLNDSGQMKWLTPLLDIPTPPPEKVA